MANETLWTRMCCFVGRHEWLYVTAPERERTCALCGRIEQRLIVDAGRTVLWLKKRYDRKPTP